MGSEMCIRDSCPYCGEPRPTFAIATTDRWQMVVEAHGAEIRLPHRLFHPFSLELSDKTEYEAILDLGRRSATHVRGTEQLPATVSFEFVEGVR